MADSSTQPQSQGAGYKAPERLQNPAQALDQSVHALLKYGGFEFLETSIDGVKNMNPERKALKRIFLTDAEKKKERAALKKRLHLWLDLMSESADLNAMVEKAADKGAKAEESLKENLKTAHDAARGLETAYRSTALFYKNTESDKLKNVTVVNASLDQLKDTDTATFINYIGKELDKNYDRLDLKDNYSILALPGYLGSNMVIDKWAKIAHKNKVMLVTDFENLDNVDEVIDEFESKNHTSADMHKSNVMMACNWLVGRSKNQSIGEEEDVMVPPSSALAGKLYTTLMSQVTAGVKFGGMDEVEGVKFELKKSDIGNLDRIGLIPMVNEYGKVMAFSAKTLFDCDNLGLQTYSVVRVFDYINKTLIDFLNRRAFENWTSLTEKDLREQIVKFLNRIQGPTKLIERFRIERLEQDEDQKDRIHLDIHVTPYFPAKSFMLKLDGTKGDDGGNRNWETSTEQN
jgi:hypothetical protein